MSARIEEWDLKILDDRGITNRKDEKLFPKTGLHPEIWGGHRADSKNVFSAKNGCTFHALSEQIFQHCGFQDKIFGIFGELTGYVKLRWLCLE